MRWGTETPRAAPLPWVPVFTGTTMGEWGSARAGGGGLREPQGERIWEALVPWGVGDAMGDGDAPRCEPALGSRFHGNDDGGVGVMRGLVVG